MKVKLYAVLDKTSGVYDGPYPGHNDGVALRNFSNQVTSGQGVLSTNPECFSLWRIGEWNDATGEVTPEVKECLAHAQEIMTASLNEMSKEIA